MKVHLCGVRGSTPAPGPEFVGVGGHTSCVAIAADGDIAPSLILDAGTGIRRVSALCGGNAFCGTILLTHLHWDHVHGLPFFGAADRDDAEVKLVLPAQGMPAADLLARGMSPPHFPIGPDGLRGRWTFSDLDEGEYDFGAFHVVALEIPHKGGRTFGYRVTDGSSALTYMPDHGPIAHGGGPEGWGVYEERTLALAGDVDLLIHDATHTVAEFPSRSSWGHCPADYAVEFGRRASAREVLLFHHDPGRSDVDVFALADSFADAGVAVRAAVEGDVARLRANIPPVWERAATPAR